MKYEAAIETLDQMAYVAKKVIVADFYPPKTLKGKIGIEIDEFVSGHYSQFCEYKKNGYFPHLASLTKLRVVSTQETSIDRICIWELESDIFS